MPCRTTWTTAAAGSRMFELRDYQQQLVERADAAMAANGIPCIVCPTGGGKTVILSELCRRALLRRERVVIVAHRFEIVLQIVASLRKHLGNEVPIEVVTAGTKARWNRWITVGMVPTLARRCGHLRVHMQGCTLLQDECHHAGAGSWAKVTEALAPARRCGLTATPVRPNGNGLGDEGGFTELLVGPHPDQLMGMGALCRYKLFATPHAMNTKGLRKRGGDYATSDLEQRVVEINGNVVPDWRKFNPAAASTIAVAVSVKHAYELRDLYRADGITAQVVDGETAKVVRERTFRDFRSGALTVLVACAVIDEGLDVPEATVLQVTRPTASLRLWRQLVGRVLRPAPGKSHAVIIDHTDNWKRLPLPDARVEWELNPDKKPFVMRRQVEVDPLTQELKVGQELVVEATGAELQEITLEVIAKAKPQAARRMFNQRLQMELTAVQCGDAEAATLQPWLSRIAVLEPQNLQALADAMRMPAGWVQAQVMLNTALPAHKLGATKQAQAELLR